MPGIVIGGKACGFNSEFLPLHLIEERKIVSGLARTVEDHLNKWKLAQP
jgi:hypothetical protein